MLTSFHYSALLSPSVLPNIHYAAVSFLQDVCLFPTDALVSSPQELNKDYVEWRKISI